ncbi:interleukin 12 receptor, beta 2a, like isoform X1 [Hippoglossus hippoglossus]|uniref:interleukin 12 receptor, beta 2a, like isoform X1 n=1 Tax=Hippoglossus hippoglossus TaxID=8267 RepID=UPI00148D7B69|nr:interleukin 12 receptor, beta 2a, like isoform X1 [Hippoglossus hippoglossus]
MATLGERWILSILLVHLQTGLAATGRPAPPSHLECFMPCDEKSCSPDIHCTWDPGPDPQITTNYSLHWEPTNSEQGHVTRPTSSSVIDRQHFNHGQLHVWVEAKNKHGSAKSRENVFNTADIIKPPPPNITGAMAGAEGWQEPLEIEWRSFCDELHLSMGTCDVRNRAEGNQVWLEHEGGYLHTYTLESPLPDTFYEFQVRCNCSEGLISDWSTSHRIRSAERAPVGKLDIWMDCGLLPASFDCSLTWKTLPLSQACGAIVGYKVKLFYNNSTWRLLNLSPAETRGLLLCNEKQCRLTSSLKDVSSVSASALNSRGATAPSHLAMQTQGKDEDVKTINLKMNEENLTVAWDLPSKPLSKLKEYVVQYKQVESRLGQGFDWVKVTNNQTTVFFKGHFIKHTPFQVSLFTISHDMTVRYLSSVIGYSLEGIPSSVPSFQALSIAATRVTLCWTAVPLSKQNGLIQNYQIGLGEKVHTVRASPQTFTLKHLSPGQEYEVWIRAVTKAGPGAKATTTFKTESENYDLLKLVLLPLLFMGLICAAIVCFCLVAENKMCPQVNLLFNKKVPDPRNSNIFRGMKHQINDPFGSISIPIPEPHPNISVLEVVKIQPDAVKSTPKETSDQEEQRDDAVTKECGRMDHSHGREEYSKMVDSDEERDREEDKDDCWSSSEEDQLTSGYEKHFMPTALEILDV